MRQKQIDRKTRRGRRARFAESFRKEKGLSRQGLVVGRGDRKFKECRIRRWVLVGGREYRIVDLMRVQDSEVRYKGKDLIKVWNRGASNSESLEKILKAKQALWVVGSIMKASLSCENKVLQLFGKEKLT